MCLLFLFLAAALPAMGRKEKVDEAKDTEQLSTVELLKSAEKAAALETSGTNICVSGILRLTGTGYFPELVITGQDGEWYIAAEEKGLLMDLQQRFVTVEGVETVAELKFASGISAGVRRVLSDIKIVSVQ